ncbi:hypothetical protein NXV77_23285 [Parabacteroides faecis]|nr:hypothetical protein [Parabacteroides faecis]MCS2893927.1 hypothetical protein [Parabacteroides faecis]
MSVKRSWKEIPWQKKINRKMSRESRQAGGELCVEVSFAQPLYLLLGKGTFEGDGAFYRYVGKGVAAIGVGDLTLFDGVVVHGFEVAEVEACRTGGIGVLPV